MLVQRVIRRRVPRSKANQDTATASQRKPSSKLKRTKIVLAGDGFCGKTSLQIAFRCLNECRSTSHGHGRDSLPCFSREYSPTVFENFSSAMTVPEEMDCGDGKDSPSDVEIEVWDTAGQEDYERLRPLSYPGADVIVLCFAVDSPDSLHNATTKWAQELRRYCPKVPIPQ